MWSDSCTPTVHRETITVNGDPDIPYFLQAEVRRWQPGAGVHRGTVVFASGSGGTAFLSNDIGINKMMNELAAIGFTVIDFRWLASWRETNYGNRVEASRFARWSGRSTTTPSSAVLGDLSSLSGLRVVRDNWRTP